MSSDDSLVDEDDSVKEILPSWIIVCSNLAPVASIIYYLAPIPTMMSVIRYKSTLGMPLLSYSVMVASAYVWVLYGILLQRKRIIISSGAGMVLGALYFFILARYKRIETIPKWFHLLCVTVIMITMSALAFCLERSEAIDMVGDMGAVFTLLMFAAPLSAIKTVIETNTSMAIPLPLTVASVVACALWSIVGLGKMHDEKVYVPEILGLVLSLVQVGVKWYYWDSRECGCGAEETCGVLEYADYYEEYEAYDQSSLQEQLPPVV